MKAEWEEWFNEGGTEPRPFTRLDGSRVDVPTMVAFRGGLSPAVPYVRGDGWEALEIRYRSRPETPQLAMTIVMPADLPRFESSLTVERLQMIVSDLDKVLDGWDAPGLCDSETGCYPYDLELYMPKFGIETRAELGELLATLGMPAAFDPAAADFSGIHVPRDPSESLFIKNVIHQANIDVDEKGTEAAAATAVGMDTGGGPSPLEQITVRLDHPFLFLLRDVETGAILFMGRVVDPSIGR
jgi:serpin B